MRVAIIGSRSFTNYRYLKRKLDLLIRDKVTCIVSGGAKGADTLGEMYADDNNIDKIIIKPDWKKYGRSAGFVRNKDIIDKCDVVIAFWDGKSKGTEDSINIAKKQKKEVVILWDD